MFMNIDKIFNINTDQKQKMASSNQALHSPSLTLAGAIQGRKYKIDKISGGHGLNSRLLSVGFLPGEVISVINQSGWGPLTVLVKGSKIALGRGIAHKILIQELDQKSNG
jgi:ferrous iron transport protein A